MTLSETQFAILSAASQRDNRIAVLPGRLTGGVANKVVDALVGRGLIEAVTAAVGMPVWRKAQDGTALALRITDAGLVAVGVQPKPERDLPAEIDHMAFKGASPQASAPRAELMKSAHLGWETGDVPEVTASVPEATSRKATYRLPRPGTKLDRFLKLLHRPEGVSISEAAEALEWQQHTVRGAVAGALKKKLGMTVATEKVEGRGTVYRVGG